MTNECSRTRLEDFKAVFVADLNDEHLRTIRFALEEYATKLEEGLDRSIAEATKQSTIHEDKMFLHNTLAKVHTLLFEYHYAMEAKGLDL